MGSSERILVLLLTVVFIVDLPQIVGNWWKQIEGLMFVISRQILICVLCEGLLGIGEEIVLQI